MTATITLVLALLVATVVCASLATRLRVPYAIVLVLAGARLGLLPGLPTVELNPDLILFLFLPPLVYSSAWQIRLSGVSGESAPDLAVGHRPGALYHRGCGCRVPRPAWPSLAHRFCTGSSPLADRRRSRQRDCEAHGTLTAARDGVGGREHGR
jgi:hypothetical protein